MRSRFFAGAAALALAAVLASTPASAARWGGGGHWDQWGGHFGHWGGSGWGGFGLGVAAGYDGCSPETGRRQWRPALMVSLCNSMINRKSK